MITGNYTETTSYKSILDEKQRNYETSRIAYIDKNSKVNII